MKSFKPYSIFLLFIVIVFNSCIVKSLNAFYTKEVLHFEPNFIGNWEDSDNGVWEIKSFGEFYKDLEGDLDQEDKKALKKYSKYNNIGYYINYCTNSNNAAFLAIPFKINNQMFLDFTPIEDNETLKNVNSLYSLHLIDTHSLVKLEILSSDRMNIKWLDEDKLKNLINDKKIKIKHEKAGIDEDILLTASSGELVKFIEKLTRTENEYDWGKDVRFNLKRS